MIGTLLMPLSTKQTFDAVDDASKFLLRRRISSSHSSSIKKLDRAFRIANGQRPLHCTQKAKLRNRHTRRLK